MDRPEYIEIYCELKPGPSWHKRLQELLPSSVFVRQHILSRVFSRLSSKQRLYLDRCVCEFVTIPPHGPNREELLLIIRYPDSALLCLSEAQETLDRLLLLFEASIGLRRLMVAGTDYTCSCWLDPDDGWCKEISEVRWAQ